MEKIKELWVRLGLRDSDYPAQDLVCDGCRPGNMCAYSELLACTNERAIDNCGMCNEYPCSLILAAFEKSDKLHVNAVKVCTTAEMAMLKKAFFMKRQTLNQIHWETKKKK